MSGRGRFDLSTGCWCSGILNVGRKTKIRISAAAVVLGVVTWVFWPELVQGEVRIIFVGLSSNDSHRASFVITNSSKNSVRYYMGWQEEKRGVWQQPDVWTRDNTSRLLNKRSFFEDATFC